MLCPRGCGAGSERSFLRVRLGGWVGGRDWCSESGIMGKKGGKRKKTNAPSLHMNTVEKPQEETRASASRTEMSGLVAAWVVWAGGMVCGFGAFGGLGGCGCGSAWMS